MIAPTPRWWIARPLRDPRALAGGPFACVAQDRPDKVKGLVLVEPAGFGDMARSRAHSQDKLMVAIFGDYIAQDARWPTIQAT